MCFLYRLINFKTQHKVLRLKERVEHKAKGMLKVEVSF